MQTLRIALIVVLGSGLILSLMSSWRDRQELQKITAANNILRENLGEMSVALATKDKEIDRVQHSPCPPK
jgi:hypothetical protein